MCCLADPCCSFSGSWRFSVFSSFLVLFCWSLLWFCWFLKVFSVFLVPCVIWLVPVLVVPEGFQWFFIVDGGVLLVPGGCQCFSPRFLVFFGDRMTSEPKTPCDQQGAEWHLIQNRHMTTWPSSWWPSSWWSPSSLQISMRESGGRVPGICGRNEWARKVWERLEGDLEIGRTIKFISKQDMNRQIASLVSYPAGLG